MSAKNRDRHGRWRSKTIAFRVSDEENSAIEEAISLAGMTKRDYIIRKLMNKDVVVVGNPRVHKALKLEMKRLCEALLRLQTTAEIDDMLLDTINLVARIYDGLKDSPPGKHLPPVNTANEGDTEND